MTEKGTPAIQERRARLELARKILIGRKQVGYKKAVALLSYNLGITERKAKEYIDTLVQVDGIKREGDLVIRRE